MTSVVIADDQELVRSGLRLVLEARGIHVLDEAPDGRRAGMARRSRQAPPTHLPPRQLFVRRTPHTPKSSASEKLRNVGDSTWMTPLASCVWIGEMKCSATLIPIPAGTFTGLPSTKTSRC